MKNRFVPPFLECEVYLNFKRGLDKLSGLKEMAVNHGVVIQNGSTYALPGAEGKEDKKLGYYKNWKDDEALWNDTILPALEEKLLANYKYSD